MASPRPLKEKAADRAYARLREMIVRLELEPGCPLDDRTLTQKCGVGRTPLREAINRLAAEKLVVIAPRRGAFVAEIRDGDAWQLFEARLQTERLAARLAAERITAAQLRRLESLVSTLPRTPTFVDTRELDWEFHKVIAEATQNRYLLDVIERLYCLGTRLRCLRYPYESVERAADYRTILTAIRRRDPARAEAARWKNAYRQHSHLLHET